MCTVTWNSTQAGYELRFNRDEHRTRGPASAPLIERIRGVRCVAPRDTTAGGSWLGGNEHGAVTGILNHYSADTTGSPPGRTSRGLLLLEMLPCSGLEEVEARVTSIVLADYSPFTLLHLDPEGRPSARTWDGRALTRHPLRPGFPQISTSSHRTEEVLASRRAVLQAMLGVGRPGCGDALMAYHRSHLPERGPLSVCMHRDDAHTVSFSHVIVSATALEFRYCGDAPCRMGQPGVVTLPRRH